MTKSPGAVPASWRDRLGLSGPQDRVDGALFVVFLFVHSLAVQVFDLHLSTPGGWFRFTLSYAACMAVWWSVMAVRMRRRSTNMASCPALEIDQEGSR